MSAFKLKILQRVRFQIKNFTTCPVLILKNYNASDFELKKIQRVRFWKINFSSSEVLKKKLHSINHVLAFFTPWKRNFCSFLKSLILNSKKYEASDFNFIKIQRVRFWFKIFSTCQSSNKKIFDSSDFELKNLQRVRFRNEDPTTCTCHTVNLHITMNNYSLRYFCQLDDNHRSNNTSFYSFSQGP